jgi:hypothetical protein
MGFQLIIVDPDASSDGLLIWSPRICFMQKGETLKNTFRLNEMSRFYNSIQKPLMAIIMGSANYLNA